MDNKKLTKTIIVAVIAALVLITLISAIKVIPTGYTGVRKTFGQISITPMEQGFNFKIPFVQSVKKINNKQQDTIIETQIWGEASDKTPVYAKDIVITYRILPEKSTWIVANVENYKEMISTSLVASAIKVSMVKLSVNEVTIRSKIEPMVLESLQASLNDKYGDGVIEIYKVVINDMNFEDAYNQAIQAKSIAQQTKEKQAIENDTAIAKAEADKKVAIANAEAKAEAKRIAAEAEAEANKKVADSLTGNVLENKFYDKWDGKLPEVMGNNSVITDINKGGNNNG